MKTLRAEFDNSFRRRWRLCWRLAVAPFVGTSHEIARAFREFSSKAPKGDSWDDFFLQPGTDIPTRDGYVLLTVDQYRLLLNALATKGNKLEGGYDSETIAQLATLASDLKRSEEEAFAALDQELARIKESREQRGKQ